MAKASPLRTDVAYEADALLTSLKMAERHHHWGMFSSTLTFIRDAGWAFAYLGPGEYALKAPPTNSRNR